MPTNKDQAAVWEHMTSTAIKTLERTTETLERVTMMLSVIVDRQTNAHKTIGAEEAALEARIGSAVNLMVKRGAVCISLSHLGGGKWSVVAYDDDDRTNATGELAEAAEIAAGLWTGRGPP